MGPQKYADYTCEAFAADTSFMQWVKHPDNNKNHDWDAFLSTHPEKADDINEARQLILSLSTQAEFSAAEKAELWDAIDSQIQTETTRKLSFRYRYAMAACLALFLVSLVLVLKYRDANALRSVSAGYASKHRVVLPDGSAIVLNSNSTLSYPKTFNPGKPREVWINGEAYFDIKHLNHNPASIKPGERFIAHANNMNIEVLGTRFNVLQRHRGTKVSLLQGKVQVSFSNLQGNVTLAPGEQAYYEEQANKCTKSTADVKISTSWMNNKVILRNTTVKELAQILEDNYGVTVTLQNPTLANEKLSGEIPSNNLDVLVKATAKALGVNISRSGNSILIHQ